MCLKTPSLFFFCRICFQGHKPRWAHVSSSQGKGLCSCCNTEKSTGELMSDCVLLFSYSHNSSSVMRRAINVLKFGVVVRNKLINDAAVPPSIHASSTPFCAEVAWLFSCYSSFLPQFKDHHVLG